MSKFFESIENVTLEKIVSILDDKRMWKNFPYVCQIPENTPDLEQLMQSIGRILSEDERSYLINLKNNLMGYSNHYDLSVDVTESTVVNCETKFREVDLGIKNKDGKKVIFADRNVGASDIYNPGSFSYYGDLEGVKSHTTRMQAPLLEMVELYQSGQLTGLLSDFKQSLGDIAVFPSGSKDVNDMTEKEIIEDFKFILLLITELSGIDTHENFNMSNNRFIKTYSGNWRGTKWNKYCETDNLKDLEASDDIASVLTDGEWKIPTKDEFQLLFDHVLYNGGPTEDTAYDERFLKAYFVYEENGIIKEDLAIKHGFCTIEKNDLNNLNLGIVKYADCLFGNNLNNLNIIGIKFVNINTSASLYLPLNGIKNSSKTRASYYLLYSGYWTSTVCEDSPLYEYGNGSPYNNAYCLCFIENKESREAYNNTQKIDIFMPRECGLLFNFAETRNTGLNIRPVKIVD
jgi:hypothetical protein